MEIKKSTDPQVKPKIIMLVYGNGGVGKTTFGSTAPKPLLVDCENGAKYFGLRGIEMDVANVNTWSDMNGLFDIAKSGEYETIIIDPIGELMEKLKRYMVSKGDKKLVQSDGSPSMAGWGWLKDTMRSTIKILRDSGVNLLLVAHVSEEKDEDHLVKRPLIMTKISDEIVNMVDIVGYMQVVQDGENEKRVILVDPTSDKYVAKDRTDQLGRIIPPNFTDIIDACQGTKTFKWSSASAVAKEVFIKKGRQEKY
jgi:phage nucleotide-binding protein